MEAHCLRRTLLAAALSVGCAATALGASFRTANFVIEAPTPQMAEQIGRAAEQYRRDLAIEWLGTEMRNWAQPCPITAQVGDQMGAGGATSFVFDHGEVFGWRMTIQGSLVRILDSVLPHEVTHTVFATHFRQPLPRWADEGACTTVEHVSERQKQQTMLINFLRTGHGIAFNRMFAMKEYPHDVMPLYSQGYSVVRYLIAQGGKQKFLEYLADGLHDENWSRATQRHYGVNDLAALQTNWLDWVRKGSPNLDSPVAGANVIAVKNTSPSRRGRPDANLILRGQSPDDVVAAAPRGDAAPTSVYDAKPAPAPRPEPSEVAENWHPPRSGERSRMVAVAPPENRESQGAAEPVPGPVAPYQATRQQGWQGPRQVILEWSRASDPAGSAYGR